MLIKIIYNDVLITLQRAFQEVQQAEIYDAIKKIFELVLNIFVSFLKGVSINNKYFFKKIN